MAIVIFDPGKFRAEHPQFSNLTDAQLSFFFRLATILIDNTEASIVPYDPPAVTEREDLLYLLVCHLATLDQRGSDTVGRLSGATQGSVSAQFAMNSPQAASWYEQTGCGALFWQLTVKYRGFRYYGYHEICW